MSNTKVLMGFTFTQLHGAMTNAELTTAAMMFSMEQLRENPEFKKSVGDRGEIFIQIAKEEVETMQASLNMNRVWDHMRNVYDSEQKFDDAVDMMAEMGNMSTVIGKASMRVVQRMMELEVQ